MRLPLSCVTIVTSPLPFATILQPTTDHPFIQELVKRFAMIGYAILAMHFVLAVRFAWLERTFGLDIIFQHHRRMGILAAAFLLAHPVLYASAGEWDLLFSFDHAWEVAVGKVGLFDLGESWAGEAGHIDEALLRRVVGPVDRKAICVCGPAAMAADVAASLRRLGVSERSIHLESFSF